MRRILLNIIFGHLYMVTDITCQHEDFRRMRKHSVENLRSKGFDVELLA